ncbi:GAF domain-containing sensor histidine kinase [uncultured Gelidibacter sp.]|uniref:sensor histidine kinase n=1 Tax=uncultured Gelidibacter sp. TaxID=259318 RepID=UPI002602D0D5|nr:GAF domain-containing sensor histidine kinase [uncultured Gelidibacter sp.]
MIIPKLPANELQRLEVLKEYRLLDTIPEGDYDNITKLISTICEVPISLITILDRDRNFFKAHYGVPFQESPRDISFCGHAILTEDPIFIIKDARMDERFIDNPLVNTADAVFYAGVPLVNPEGYALGTLCIFDHQPRTLSDTQKDALIILAKQVVNSMELRRQNMKLETAKKQLTLHNVELKKFASHVSHDLKSPLANIISLTQLLKDDLSEKISSSSLEYLDYINDSALILKDYIDGILLHYKADELLKAAHQDVQLSELCEDLKQLLLTKSDVLNCHATEAIQNINKSVLTQILINLVDNALKYNDKDERIIDVSYTSLPEYHEFSVSDNGIGIAKNKQELIFQLFTSIPHKNDTKPSTGIGLSTIKNLVIKLGGDIHVSSKLGKGSVFTFTIAK